MLHNARSLKAINIHARRDRAPRDRRPPIKHGEIAIHDQALDLRPEELEEGLLEVGDDGGSTVSDERVVLDVVRGYVLRESLGVLSLDVEALDEAGEDKTLFGVRDRVRWTVGFGAGD